MEENGGVEIYGRLESLDIVVITAYLLVSIVIGVMFARRGTKDTTAYFVSGRGMPWWLVGFGLAATCFAADTPLWVGDMIYKRGIEGAWLHWITGIGFSFYVFVIAPLWRRSHIITDLELLELRYSGKAASFLRLINSLYFSLFFNIMMMGVSTLSITTVMQATTGLPKIYCVLITVGGALIYCVVSGMWGIAATDFMQFFVTFIGSAILAGFALVAVGGKAELVAFLQQDTQWAGHELNVMPGLGAAAGLPMMTVFFLLFFRWWDNASIGAYVSQRIFAAKSVRHATIGAMTHSLVYWSIVPLPWIITICAARKYMPGLADGQEAYPRMAMAVLPVGFKGIIVASMLAAFMSTYSSLLSWGSSYAINDFYRRFLVKNRSDKHYVRGGQLFMIPMAIGAALIALYADSIFNLLTYLFLVPAAVWTVQLLRWLWWRVNAWAEAAALISGAVITIAMTLAYTFREAWGGLAERLFPAESSAYAAFAGFASWMDPDYNEQYWGHKFLSIILISLAVWLIVMYRTKATDPERLDVFVRRVNPPGFWGAVRERTGVVPVQRWRDIFYGWAVMLVAIYCPLVGLIKLFFGNLPLALLLLAIGVGGITLAVRKALAMKEEEEDHVANGSAQEAGV